MTAILEKLNIIQSKLKAPKGQYNKFGNYNYRSCEDILEALKPLLAENKMTLIINDNIEQLGERYYLKATCTLFDAETGEKVSNSAYARETDTRKSMDTAQITGSVSSYARKYALNGLFAIDDTKDIDTNENYKQTQKNQSNTQRNAQGVDISKVRNEIAQTLKAKNYDFNKFVEYLKKTYGVEKIENLPVEKLVELKNTVSHW
ncbi:MAG: ERF family protein [Peptoniphilus harei]|nr:ERF family protein [Peptoniphilus harei]